MRVGVCLNECTRKGWNLGDRQPGVDAPYRRIIFGWNLMSKHLVFPQPEEAEVRPQPLYVGWKLGTRGLSSTPSAWVGG